MNPWPPHPCHSCAEYGCGTRPVTEGNLYASPGYSVGDTFYTEGSGYHWHTAGHNLETGEWHASCCLLGCPPLRGWTVPANQDLYTVSGSADIARIARYVRESRQLLDEMRRIRWTR